MPRSSRHLVDPELLPLLGLFPPLDLNAAALVDLRSRVPRLLEDAWSSTRLIPGPSGAPEVRVVIHVPPTELPPAPQGAMSQQPLRAPRPCILHIHGGGFVMGSPNSLQQWHRRLARESGCVIVSVDYRLAPETRFPGALEDCYAALAWVHAEAASLGIDPGRIGVMGESAGGCLAAALALLARDRGAHALAFQHLVYPMLDDRTCVTIDPHPYAGEFLWTATNNTFGWTSLLPVPPGSPSVSPYAAPARATDLAGLPPAFISAAALDLLLDEDVDYAVRLSRHGVPVELHVYPGCFHAFDMAPAARVVDTARRDTVSALLRATGQRAPAGN